MARSGPHMYGKLKSLNVSDRMSLKKEHSIDEKKAQRYRDLIWWTRYAEYLLGHP